LSLRRIQEHWTFFGREDPLRSILQQGAGWDTDEFFHTGVLEIESVLQYVESLHPLRSRARALDFGCGVGRLTQALALHFDKVRGVDISPSMIEHARRYNRHGARCEYVLNETSDLGRFADGEFDFIYSNITLQHMPRRLIKRYLAEFLRVLDPAGALLFQLPGAGRDKLTAVLSLAHNLYYRVVRPKTPVFPMHGIHKDDVIRFFTKRGGAVLDVTSDAWAGPHWKSFRYLVTR